ncbi:uncharacterized protein PFL1_04485 [Pseudozyma flocculosa PF-1]|uniref:U1 small nuclear ribonucleoprotein 70 kDa n=1 Tax=Pseudozyma flocculosa PF-1 TaxID=1277687 RepID=A0A061H6A4_9BASI|nr:uncharacterized protein PFL1_04485 [Pseudozyma flocculosa PF-1]EPQ28158.1 hypothetical protein PFL1_04485 [Pseudozyma flocculosa PF-1]
MTHQLPPNLIRLFTSRPPLPYTPPLPGDQDPNDPPQPKDRDEISNRKKVRPLDGVAAFLERVKQEAADRGEATDDIDEQGQAQQFTHAKITLAEMAKEEKKRKKEQEKKEGLEKYDPNKDPEAIGDPFKTLFLARLSYDTTEKDLHREFDMYGPIERIRLVRDKEGKSRGYAFVLYERERDMRAAYKDAEGLKINGRRIMVDVERGRAGHRQGQEAATAAATAVEEEDTTMDRRPNAVDTSACLAIPVSVPVPRRHEASDPHHLSCRSTRGIRPPIVVSTLYF